jgi:hypothetical protein
MAVRERGGGSVLNQKIKNRNCEKEKDFSRKRLFK